MIRKYPKDSVFKKYFIKGAKVAIAAELLCCAACYGFWRTLNTSQDSRFYFYQNYNWMLEGYYKIGEILSKNSGIRENDLLTWREQGKI